jgi:hypothetical protein
MGSEYTDNGGIEKIGLGEQAGAWGTTTNNNFDIIDRLINGVVSVTLSSGGTSKLITSDGSLSDGMHKVIVLGGSPDANHIITIEPPSADKLYFVKNGTSQDIAFSQGSGANATVLSGKGAIIFADGGGDGAVVTDLTALFVNSQAIDGAVIGGTTPAAGTFTTLTANTSILPDTSGGADIGSTSAEFGDIYVADDKKIKFGSDQDVSIEYDEDGTDSLLISGGDVTLSDDKKLFFGTDKDVSIEYDEDGTDTLLISGGDITIADDKKLNFGTDKDVSIEYDEDGNDTMLITGDVVFADGTTDVDIASHDGTNGLKLGGTVVTRTAAQINAARDGTVTSVAVSNTLSGSTITSTGTIGLNTGLGEIGTYAMLGRQSGGGITAGTIYAGSSLVFSGFASDGSTFTDNTAADIRGSAPGGNWRAMGHVASTSRFASTLFLRVS